MYCFLLLLVVAGINIGNCVNVSTEALECDAPDLPNNAYLLDASRMIGTTVRVLCKPGYYWTGTPPYTMTCKNDSQWTQIDLKCRAQGCRDPGHPWNGRRLGYKFNFLDLVYFKCNHGYVLEGPSWRRCQANLTWSDQQPICKPLSCGRPPIVQYSTHRIYGFPSGYFFGNKVGYSCQPGFKRVGEEFLRCGKDLKWTGNPPRCQEIKCPLLSAPANGSLFSSNENYTNEGERVRYTCQSGFVMIGRAVRTCLRTGRWTGPEPICFRCSEAGTPVFIRHYPHYKRAKIVSKSGHKVTVRYDEDSRKENIILLGPGTRHYIVIEDRVPSRREILVGSHVLAYNFRLGKFQLATVLAITKDSKYVVRHVGRWKETSVVGLMEIRTREPPRFCGNIGNKCQPCPNVDLKRVCRDSTVAFIAKVVSRLANDDKKGLQRYAIDVQYVLKNTTQAINEGQTVISVPVPSPLVSKGKCACPRIPLNKKFILISQTTHFPRQSKTGLVLSKFSYVKTWNSNIRRKVKIECQDTVAISSYIH